MSVLQRMRDQKRKLKTAIQAEKERLLDEHNAALPLALVRLLVDCIYWRHICIHDDLHMCIMCSQQQSNRSKNSNPSASLPNDPLTGRFSVSLLFGHRPGDPSTAQPSTASSSRNSGRTSPAVSSGGQGAAVETSLRTGGLNSRTVSSLLHRRMNSMTVSSPSPSPNVDPVPLSFSRRASLSVMPVAAQDPHLSVVSEDTLRANREKKVGVSMRSEIGT